MQAIKIPKFKFWRTIKSFKLIDKCFGIALKYLSYNIEPISIKDLTLVCVYSVVKFHALCVNMHTIK